MKYIQLLLFLLVVNASMAMENPKSEIEAMIENRKINLLKKIREKSQESGYVLLLANYENECCCAFKQESSFFYLTGINEPGCAVLINPEGKTTLYIPRYQLRRSDWLECQIDSIDKAMPGIDNIEYLGQEVPGYVLSCTATLAAYNNILSILENIKTPIKLYTLYQENSGVCQQQQNFLWRLFQKMPDLKKNLIDISSIVAQMRRKKSDEEIDSLRKAIEITHRAHHAAKNKIREGAQECDVQMALERVMRREGAVPGFGSIVGAGINSTVLHSTKNTAFLKNGDVVVVDIGAQVDGYSADITRTYPVSGAFTARQQEIYDIVLATQKFVEAHAKPGVWLSNKNQQDKSLHHLAVKFLKERGYSKYFNHGIGHFLGLDVHDVGDRNEALGEGDVITIEPGIYIPKEKIGVRIEDDYLITSDGVECLSINLEK